jgi:putative serine protease PepD
VPRSATRWSRSATPSGSTARIESPNGFSIDKVIQTDAAVNPGNSGGPLLNAKGEVIGVNSQIATAAGGGEGNIGISFSIPSNTVKQVLPSLESGTAPQHAYLGLQTTQPRSGKGALIAQTTSGGPSERAGLQPGDLVTEVGGHSVSSPDEVAAAIADRKPGDKVTVTVERNGSQKTFDVTLGQRPETVPSQQAQPLQVP